MIGRVGVVLGDAGVNIGHMDVGPVAGVPGARDRHAGGEALMILSVDEAIPERALEQIRGTADIFAMTSVLL